MKKVTFKYKKEDGSITNRELLNPSFLKESYNSYKEFEKNEVKYLTGLEIIKEGMSEEQFQAYKNSIKEYYSEIYITLDDYLTSKGLNSKNVALKTFKKEGVKDLNLLEED